MATDPVTAAQTNKVNGFMVFNWFYLDYDQSFQSSLSRRCIFSYSLDECICPYIDHFVIRSNIKMRLNRLKIKAT